MTHVILPLESFLLAGIIVDTEFLLDEDSAYLLKAFNPRAQLVQELECCHDSILGME